MNAPDTPHPYPTVLLTAADLPAMYRLFESSFGYAMNPALRAWKYDEGRGQQIGIWDGDRLIAHYGGMTRRVLRFAEPCLACQIGDVMVEPSYRGRGGRRGPFFHVMAGYSEAYCGYGKQHLIGYGFPTYDHMRLASLLRQYQEVDRMVEMLWTPASTADRLHGKVVDGPWLLRQKNRVGHLWSRMARDLQDGMVTIRDADYLHYRYCQHPTRQYTIHLVQQGFWRKDLGLLVVQDNQTDELEIMDLIGPLAHFPQLLDYARRLAQQLGRTRLKAWGSHRVAAFLPGHQATPLDVYVPACTWTPGPDPLPMRHRWWLMLGDTDFR